MGFYGQKKRSYSTMSCNSTNTPWYSKKNNGEHLEKTISHPTSSQQYLTYMIPWAYTNIPIPPGLREKVVDLLKEKVEAGVYEPSQSSYRSRWFCVLKKNGKLRIVHDLQPLNGVTIRDAGLPPILDAFVEPFAGRQCYSAFDLHWGFDARKIHPTSRDLTAFMSPLGLLRLTSLPMGFTNSPAEFQAWTCHYIP